MPGVAREESEADERVTANRQTDKQISPSPVSRRLAASASPLPPLCPETPSSAQPVFPYEQYPSINNIDRFSF